MNIEARLQKLNDAIQTQNKLLQVLTKNSNRTVAESKVALLVGAALIGEIALIDTNPRARLDHLLALITDYIENIVTQKDGPASSYILASADTVRRIAETIVQHRS